MAQPREALEVRVDDEPDDRDRPEPAHDGSSWNTRRGRGRTRPRKTRAPVRAKAVRPEARVPPYADCARRSRRRSGGSTLIASERAPTIANVIQRRSCAEGTTCTLSSAPMYANGSANTVCSIFTSDAKRARERDRGAHVARCSVGSPAISSSAWASAGLISSKPSRQPPGEPGRLTISVCPRMPARPRPSKPCGVLRIASARSASAMPGLGGRAPTRSPPA